MRGCHGAAAHPCPHSSNTLAGAMDTDSGSRKSCCLNRHATSNAPLQWERRITRRRQLVRSYRWAAATVNGSTTHELAWCDDGYGDAQAGIARCRRCFIIVQHPHPLALAA
ncbi:hypothetical protein C2845_PM07G11610 [Panicum miliaceum]|uniref:Uncharacterized protein n=1 Tax=Panicum miliaceum TaxID=4540 RepID=A0A3L6SQQ2_PANMI|nr:hypothetical protein C2845_PM07G11610 [Panicum miliaceum]